MTDEPIGLYILVLIALWLFLPPLGVLMLFIGIIWFLVKYGGNHE